MHDLGIQVVVMKIIEMKRVVKMRHILKENN